MQPRDVTLRTALEALVEAIGDSHPFGLGLTDLMRWDRIVADARAALVDDDPHGLNCFVTDEVGCVCGHDQRMERELDRLELDEQRLTRALAGWDGWGYWEDRLYHNPEDVGELVSRIAVAYREADQ